MSVPGRCLSVLPAEATWCQRKVEGGGESKRNQESASFLGNGWGICEGREERALGKSCLCPNMVLC